MSEAEYPMRKNDSKWTSEYRKEWNREYRKKIKEGKINPIKRTDKPSKWDDKDFRKKYDQSRKEKLNAEKKEKKINLVDVMDGARPNFTKEEKEIILEKMLNEIKDGKKPTHPYFKIGLVSVNKRYYPKKE